MTPDIVNPTPKSRFTAAEQNIKDHHALLENPAFQKAEDFALLSYQRSLAKTVGTDPNPQVAAVVAGLKLTGVQEFLAEFHNLAEKPVETQPPGINRTLNQRA